MRAREILDENYNQSLESDLNNLLVGAKGAGAQEINTRDLIVQLNGMGYSVNANSIMLLLSRNPMVLNATPTVIKMTGAEGASAGAEGSVQDTDAKVSDLAAKATKIG